MCKIYKNIEFKRSLQKGTQHTNTHVKRQPKTRGVEEHLQFAIIDPSSSRKYELNTDVHKTYTVLLSMKRDTVNVDISFSLLYTLTILVQQLRLNRTLRIAQLQIHHLHRHDIGQRLLARPFRLALLHQNDGTVSGRQQHTTDGRHRWMLAFAQHIDQSHGGRMLAVIEGGINVGGMLAAEQIGGAQSEGLKQGRENYLLSMLKLSKICALTFPLTTACTSRLSAAKATA